MKVIKNVVSQINRAPTLQITIAILSVGFLLRCIIAPFTLNWDLLANTKTIYSWSQLSSREFYEQPLATYPPLTYHTLSFFLRSSMVLLGPNFTKWVNLPDLFLLTDPYIFRYLFAIKLPYILLELTTAFFFSKIFALRLQSKALLFWMLNPIALFTLTAWTNVDVLPILCMVLGIYFYLRRGSIVWSAVSFGFGVAFKLFPIFAVPFFLLTLRSWRQRVFAAALIALPVALTHYPLLKVSAYWAHVIFGGQSQNVFYFSAIPLGLDRVLLFFYFSYALILFHFSTVSRRKTLLPLYMWCSLLPIFLFSKFNVPWMYWLIPLLIMHLISQKALSFSHSLYIFYFLIIFLSQASLNIGMLAPLEPTLSTLDWPVRDVLKSGQTNNLLSICQSIFSAALITVAWIIYQKKIDPLYEKA